LQSGITIHINSEIPYNTLDIFVYADTLSRPLETHIRMGNEKFCTLQVTEGDKTVVALGNVPGVFEDKVPANYAEAELLCMRYCNENPDAPLLSGYTHAYAAPGARCELTVMPLLCPVEIRSISIEGDAALMNPVLQLEEVSESAQVLRTSGFYPAATLNSAESLLYPLMMVYPLPFDAGNKPQKCGVTLWCYPNESDPVPGGAGTRLVVSGRLNGSQARYEIPLGKVLRGARIRLDIALQ
jgi:hypothetical protein